MSEIARWELRSRFARRLSDMYGQEVPAYNTLLEVSQEVNLDVLASKGEDAQRYGTIGRVTQERHGAIRVGSPRELSQVARVFAALGMTPVGFYDLREAASSSVPVVSTAFRPTSAEELARNPFRVFTSMLTTSDRRFFSEDVQRRAEDFISARVLFDTETLALADLAVEQDGLSESDAEAFIAGAVAAFEISQEAVDGPWYRELEAISAVASDIAGVASTHINHLTPRVLDIDELYRRMQERGVTMIDDIQGPPRWDGPDVLLRQTSFRALSEPRRFREEDGSVVEASLRVRFGEVEARGIALTATGRERYDRAISEVDERVSAGEGPRQEVAGRVWADRFPRSERELLREGLAFFSFRVGRVDDVTVDEAHDLPVADLVERGALIADPIVYEDFLPRSAAGIFQSNLSEAGTKDSTHEGVTYSLETLSDMIGVRIEDPTAVYAAQSARSESDARQALVGAIAASSVSVS